MLDAPATLNYTGTGASKHPDARGRHLRPQRQHLRRPDADHPRGQRHRQHLRDAVAGFTNAGSRSVHRVQTALTLCLSSRNRETVESFELAWSTRVAHDHRPGRWMQLEGNVTNSGGTMNSTTFTEVIPGTRPCPRRAARPRRRRRQPGRKPQARAHSPWPAGPSRRRHDHGRREQQRWHRGARGERRHLNISSDYIQGAGGTLEIEVEGTEPGEYDVLNAVGSRRDPRWHVAPAAERRLCRFCRGRQLGHVPQLGRRSIGTFATTIVTPQLAGGKTFGPVYETPTRT